MAAIVVLGASPAAGQSLAGLTIANVATLRDATGATIGSNVARLVVAERLDCALTRGDAGSPATALLVLLTNPGNGDEAFVVTATAGADATPRPIAVDAAGDGRFDPARDRPLDDGVTPVVAPGATLRLLVPLGEAAAAGAAGAAGTAVTVTARAVTGSGAPGTSLPGRGDGGGDAVIGTTGAEARLTVALAAEEPPTIVESQSVLAGDGGPVARRGSVITYTITTRFASASVAARVVNAIPANTAYRAGTLTLDGEAIADAGRVGDGRIVVGFGAVTAGAVHRVTFQAIIQ